MIFAAYLPSKGHEFDGKSEKDLRGTVSTCEPEFRCRQSRSVPERLRVRLAGDAWYFGKLVKKKYIGDDLRPVEPEDIRRANRLLYRTSWILMEICAMWEAVMEILSKL